MKVLYTIFLCVNSFIVCGQKQDYVWLSGYESSAGLDSFTNKMFGISKLDFNSQPVQVSYDSLNTNFDFTISSYSNNNGDLLFYTNGVQIVNAQDEILENGDSLSAGYVMFSILTNMLHLGYRIPQGIITLEDPAQPNCFYLVHSMFDTLGSPSNIVTRRILCSYVDMNANNGLGKVFYKNRELLDGRFGGELQAVRHGNGQDWWIAVQKRGTNCYKKIIINALGINVVSEDCFENPINTHAGAACFSPDGTKYVYLSGEKGLNLFDFDRCSGKLSNPKYFPLPFYIDSGLLAMGTAFSPNGRFLYINLHVHCYQFDLEAPDIWSSIDTVAVFDGGRFPMASWFHTMQLGPDGRIYAACGNTEYVYHVIENPDLKGSQCSYIQHGIDLPSYAGGGLPNYPNYRLGALQDVCDTVTSIKELFKNENNLNIFPNPATDLVTVDYGFTDWNKGEITLEITNELGQLVHSYVLPVYSGLQKVNVKNYAIGIYTVSIKRNDLVITTRSFIKR